jgi:hypothetical protein
MLELVDKHLRKGAYNHQKIKEELRLEDINECLKDIAYSYEVLQQNFSFNLYERAYHVFSEAARVYEFKNVCEDASLDEDTRVQKLG